MTSRFALEDRDGSTHLIYKLPEDGVLDHIGLNMLKNNSIRNLAPLVYMQADQERYFRYNISSAVALKQVLSGAMNKRLLLTIFSEILTTTEQLCEYMLDENYLLFLPEYIYIREQTGMPLLICIPIEERIDSQANLYTLLGDILNQGRFDPDESSGYLEEMRVQLNDEQGFNLSAFHSMINSMLYGVDGASASMHREREPIGSGFVPVNSTPINMENQNASPHFSPSILPQGGALQSANPVTQFETMQSPQASPVPQGIDSSQGFSSQQHPGMPAPYPLPHQANNTYTPQLQSKAAQIIQNSKAYHPPTPVQQSMPAASNSDEGEGISLFYLLQHYNKENKAAYDAQKKRKSAKKGKPAATIKGMAVPGMEMPDVSMAGQSASVVSHSAPSANLPPAKALTAQSIGSPSKEENEISLFYLLQHYNKENKSIYDAQKQRKKSEKPSAPLRQSHQGAIAQPPAYAMGQQGAVPAQIMPRNSVDSPQMGMGVAPVPQGTEGSVAGVQVGQANYGETTILASMVPGSSPAAQANQMQQSLSSPNQTLQNRMQNPLEPSPITQISQSPQPIKAPPPIAPVNQAMPPQARSTQMSHFSQVPQDAQIEQAPKSAPPILETGISRETVLLNTAHLIREKTGEHITVMGAEFHIGQSVRQPGYQVNDNKAVSRLHAVIYQEGGKYYLADANSLNHTFLNGKLIRDGQRAMLSQGMKITLANENFTFYLG